MVLVTLELVLFQGMGMEFKVKIMLHYFREVKWHQRFTTEIRFQEYNVLAYKVWTYYSGLTVSKSMFQFDVNDCFPVGENIELLLNSG